MPAKLEITPKTIILAATFIIGGWLIVQIRDILALLFIAFILMSGLRPGVAELEKMRLPRFLAIVIMYVLVIGVIVFFGTIIFPPLVAQSINLGNNLPTYISRVTPFISLNLNTLASQIAPISQNVVRVTVGVFSNIVTIFTVAVFTFYFLLHRNHVRPFLATFVGPEMGDRIVMILTKMELRLGAWVRGQVLLALIIGMASYMGLTFLGVSYALPLALIAGVLEVVPIIGPIISAIPAVLVALTISQGLALAVVALYFIIQQLENNLIVPTVMQRAVGLPPLASLLALMIGGRLAGTIGIILAVPALLVLQTIVQEFIYRDTKTR